MKYLSIVLFALIILSSCSKGKLTAKDIYGEWKLSETLSDPGDGSGKWVKAVEEENKYLKINTDGTVESNVITDVQSYRIVDNTNVKIVFKGNPDTITYRYRIDKNKLELNPPCREACGLRFIKTN